jgi:hypothetical protein
MVHALNVHTNSEFMYIETVQLPPDYELSTVATPQSPSSTVAVPIANPFPVAQAPRQRIRVCFLRFTSSHARPHPFSFVLPLSVVTDEIVKLFGLIAQLVSVLVVISQTPMLCVVLGVLIFVFGVYARGI